MTQKVNKIRELIDTCQANKACRLSLVGLGLEEIPSEVFEMYWLERLDVSLNPLKKFPEALSRLGRLSILTMNACEISGTLDLRFLPSRLHGLFLGNNSISKINSNNEETKSSSLQYLRISGNALETVEDIVECFPDLKFLNSANNGLKVLSELIEGLDQLQVLDLSINKLTKLPRSLIGMKSLKTLDISGNNFNISIQSTCDKTNSVEDPYPDLIKDISSISPSIFM